MQILETGRLNKTAGFSLLELVVVLCILSIMTGLLAPRMFENLQGKAPAMFALEKALQEIRTKALVTGKMHMLVVDLKKGNFAPTNVDSLADTTAFSHFDKTQSLPSGVTFAGLLQHGETLERLTHAEIRVRPDGLVEPVHIRLRSTQNDKGCTLRIVPSTAKLVLMEGTPL